MSYEDKLQTNPLQWWSVRVGKFPLLSSVARRYLMTPATSVPAERIFSLAGFVVRKKRTKLLPKHVNQQIFLAKNKDHIPHKCIRKAPILPGASKLIKANKGLI